MKSSKCELKINTSNLLRHAYPSALIQSKSLEQIIVLYGQVSPTCRLEISVINSRKELAGTIFTDEQSKNRATDTTNKTLIFLALFLMFYFLIFRILFYFRFYQIMNNISIYIDTFDQETVSRF